MANLLALFKRKPQADLMVVPDRRGPGHGAVNGNSVALWRPPIMLDATGRTMPGVSLDLVANYLVTSTAMLAESELGPVTVEWKGQVNRFASVQMTIHAWGQSVEFVHPIAIVSQPLADAVDMYMRGMAQKVRELHKGHQDFSEANQTIRIAMRKLEKLRDDRIPHFNDAEFLFLMSGLGKAMTISALIPVSSAEPEPTLGRSVTRE